MSRTLTASDRSALIRLASTMPVGSTERRAILAGLTRVAMEHATPEALEKYLKAHPDADKSKHTVKKDEGGGNGGPSRPVSLDKTRHSELSDILSDQRVKLDPALPPEVAPVLDGMEAAIRKVHRRFNKVDEDSDEFQDRLQAGDELMDTVGDFFNAVNKSSSFDADTLVRLWNKSVADNAGYGLVDGEEFDQFLGPYGAEAIRKAVGKKVSKTPK